MIRKIPGGVTAAKGFQAACCAAGIKYRDRTDMAMIFSKAPCAVAGTFTANKVKAAPVLWDQQVVKSGCPARAVVKPAGIFVKRLLNIPEKFSEFLPVLCCLVPQASSDRTFRWTAYPPV